MLHPILLFSLARAGLNFADSIYSATFFLSKTVSIYPLFPLVEEIAFFNQDKTIDYSTLIDGTETKYDAINAYETLLYMHFPDVMTDEQKGNLTKSLYFVRDVDSQEMGEYCRTVYERIHQKYGVYLNLEPLSTITTDVKEVSTNGDTFHGEIIAEKRASIDDDIMADDIVDRYTLNTPVTEEFAKFFLESFSATLQIYGKIAQVNGRDIFLQATPQALPSSNDTETTKAPLNSTFQQSERILEKRAEEDDQENHEVDRARFQKTVESFALVFENNPTQNRLVQDITTNAARYFVFQNKEKFQMVALVTSAMQSIDPIFICKTVCVHPKLKQLVKTIFKEESLEKAMQIYFNFEYASLFASRMIDGVVSKTDIFLWLADEYLRNPSVSDEPLEFVIYQALDALGQISKDFSIRKQFLELRKYGPNGVVIIRLAYQLKNIKPQNKMMKEGIRADIELLEKMPFYTGKFENGAMVEANSIQFVKDEAIDFFNMQEELVANLRALRQNYFRTLPPDIKELIFNFKTPLDRLQDQFDSFLSDRDLVDILGAIDYTPGVDDDPISFLSKNEQLFKRAARQSSIVNVHLRVMVHYLSIFISDNQIGEDSAEMVKLLIGNGVDNHGIIGKSTDQLFKSDADRLRGTVKNAELNIVKKRVKVRFNRR